MGPKKPIARKATKPKKALRKAKKAKRVTKKSQTGSYRQVWNGSKLYTKGGLMKKDLVLNKRGKVISKKMAAAGKKSGANIQGWCKAVQEARKELKITGFVALNKGAQGVAIYKKAKEIYGN